MLKKFFNKIRNKRQQNNEPNNKLKMELIISDISISKNITVNLEKMHTIFKDSSDIIIREFAIGKNKIQSFIICLDGLSDKQTIDNNVLANLMMDTRKHSFDYEITIDNIKENAISTNDISTLNTLEEAVDAILNGNTVLFLDTNNTALEISTSAFERRAITEPQTENTVRGPHEGFTETLRVNTSMVRRKIKSPDIKFEAMKIGRRTRTDVCIVYISGIANDKIVDEVRRRLNSIDIDGILESNYIEELIEDAPFSIFPTVGNTETPDKFAGKILEGRVGILVDGTPMALTVPFLFLESFQTAEDYYSSPFLSLINRSLRLFAFHMTLFLPGLYVGMLNFHPGIIPQTFLQTLQVSKIDIPFPAQVEAIGMSIMWEVLRQAGILMPKPVGQAVSIVGALILGQVAVQAGLVGPVMVIIVAATGLFSYLLPPQGESVTVLRYPIMIMATFLGLYGIMWSYIFMVIHLVSIRSFGVPYISPLAPFNLNHMKDFLIRVPWWLMKKRPSTITWRESDRIADGSMPDPKT